MGLTERQQLERALRESMAAAAAEGGLQQEEAEEPPPLLRAVYTKAGGRLPAESDGAGAGGLGKARSRRERELASLAPWAWDPKVETHKPGRAMMRDFSEVSGALLPHQPREGVEHAPTHEAGGSGSPPLRAARVAHTAVPPTAGAKRPRPAEEHTPGDARRRVSSPPPRFKAMAAPASVPSPGTVSPPAGGPAARTPLSVPLASVGDGAPQSHRLHAGITSPVPWPDLEGGGGRAAGAPAAWASPYSTVAPASRPVGLTSPLCVLADAATDENKAPGHMQRGPNKHGLGMVPLAPMVVATVTKPRSSISAGGSGALFGASPRPMEKNHGNQVISPSPAALAAAAQCVRVRPAPHPQSSAPAVWRLGNHGGSHGAGFIRRSDGAVPSAVMPPPPPPHAAGAGLSPALMNGFARLQQLRAHSTDPPALAVA